MTKPTLTAVTAFGTFTRRTDHAYTHIVVKIPTQADVDAAQVRADGWARLAQEHAADVPSEDGYIWINGTGTRPGYWAANATECQEYADSLRQLVANGQGQVVSWHSSERLAVKAAGQLRQHASYVGRDLMILPVTGLPVVAGGSDEAERPALIDLVTNLEDDSQAALTSMLADADAQAQAEPQQLGYLLVPGAAMAAITATPSGQVPLARYATTTMMHAIRLDKAAKPRSFCGVPMTATTTWTFQGYGSQDALSCPTCQAAVARASRPGRTSATPEAKKTASGAGAVCVAVQDDRRVPSPTGDHISVQVGSDKSPWCSWCGAAIEVATAGTK